MQLSSDMFYRCPHHNYNGYKLSTKPFSNLLSCSPDCIAIESKIQQHEPSPSAGTWTVYNLPVGMIAEKELLLSSEVIGRKSTNRHLTRSLWAE